MTVSLRWLIDCVNLSNQSAAPTVVHCRRMLMWWMRRGLVFVCSLAASEDLAKHQIPPGMIPHELWTRFKTAVRHAPLYLAGLVQLLLHPGDGHVAGRRAVQGAAAVRGSEQQPPATDVRHSTRGHSAPSPADAHCSESSRTEPSLAEPLRPVGHTIISCFVLFRILDKRSRSSCLKARRAICPSVVDYLEFYRWLFRI